jgi:NAD(P)-dependent dehydrogenase (short-subunit alcohol dehydrogenase family)
VGIAPGIITTKESQFPPDRLSDERPDLAERITKHLNNLHPVGRTGRSEDIGAMCVFLASPWGGFITGGTLLIDGGNSTTLRELSPELVDELIAHFHAKWEAEGVMRKT